nr:c-type cytochrome [Fimbriiglobus sp.]
MPRTFLALLLFAAPAFAQREFGFDNRKGSGQAYLKPEETVAKFKVAPEFEVKLFAGEPDLVNPVAFTIDEKGRVWAIECFEYPSRTPKGKAPRDRIVILEDTDGDGKCDKRTVFAEGKDFPVTEERKKAGLGAFDLATGLEVGHGGVYVGAPPYLWFIENKNDKPGKFEPILKGFGSEDTHETLNTFQWGPDGWLYGMQGVFTNSKVESLDGPETRMNAAVWRMHPKTKKFEIFAEGTSNPWGMDWRNTDGQFILACCVIPHLYHIVPGGIYKRQAGASFNPHAYGYIQEISDHTFHKESGWAHAGLISLDVPHMPEKYRNSVIFGSIHGCSLKQNILKPNGSSYTASKGEDFLVSGDKNFRPINMKWGPNGDIYLIDWHDQMPCHQAKPDEWDYERGRVYRIQVKGTQTKKAEDLGKKTAEELGILTLESNNPYLQRTALRLLSEKDVTTRNQAFRAMLKTNRSILPDILSPRLITSQDGSVPDSFSFWADRVQKEKGFQLIRLRGLCSGDWSVNKISALGLWAEKEGDANLRREMASLAIHLADKHDVTELLHALMKHKEDAKDPLIPYLTWVAYEKVLASGGRKPAGGGKEDQGADAPRSPKLGDELAFLAKEAPDNIFVRDHIVPKVMRRLIATGQPDDLKLCVKFLADVKDVNTREKALDGLEIALRDQTVDAPAEWKALREELKKEQRLTGLVNKLAVSFRDPEAVARALAVLNDAAKPESDRAEAVRQLVQLKAKEAPDLFRKLALTDGEKAMAVRTEAARGLVAFDRSDLPKAVLAAWKALPASLQSELVNTLSARKPWAMELLKAMDAKAIDRGIVTDNHVTRMQAFNDREINALIEKAWGKTRKTPDELNKLIDKTRASLGTSAASFTAGKKVFEAQCAKCHKFEGKGAEVGPALDGAGRDIEYLLANVLDPNRVVGAPYFVRTANLQDGQIIQGLLHAEDDQSITLKTENAVLKRIARKDLDGPVKVAEKSMMPEGLTNGMTEQDFRDLIRYTMAHPYLTSVTVNGNKVAAPVTGRIALPQAENTNEVELVFDVTAADEVKTTLQLGGEFVNGFAVTLDGKVVAVDGNAAPLTLSKGKHTLSVTVSYKGGKAWV